MTDFSTTTPPHSLSAEQGLLGAILTDGYEVLDRIEGIVRSEDLYFHSHRLIFDAALRLQAIGRSPDIITVSAELEHSGQLSAAGGFADLAQLANETPSAANAAHYAKIIRERAILRGLQRSAADLLADCCNPEGRPAAQIANDHLGRIEATTDRTDSEPAAVYQLGLQILEATEQRRTSGAPAGLQTGVRQLDEMTGGLEPGQLVILAARPSVGKSALACNVASHVAAAGKTAVFFTLEMSAPEITARIIAARSGVTVQAMRAGTNAPEHWAAMSESVGAFTRWPLFIDDRPAVTVAYVRAKARRLQRSRGLELVVIDYLQLMTGTGANRAQEVGSVSRGLKALAKELRVPIIALAQLNRATENRTDRRPTLADLRDSGEIEQDADIVMMLHRESMHRDAPEWAGLAELLVRKNRNGPTGEFLLALDGPRMQFGDYDGPSPRSTTPEAPARRRGFDD